MKIMSKVHVLTIFLTCFSLGISYGWRGTHWLRHSSSTSCSHHLSMSSLTPPTSANNKILRKVDKWACISNCGACCKLGPIESRPDLDTYLTSPELEKYKSMIGSDDWCIHFDKKKRMCTIYEDRPGFCRVDAQSYKKMYDIEEDEMSDFCAFCCREQIGDVYGEDSREMNDFEDVIFYLEETDDDTVTADDDQDESYTFNEDEAIEIELDLEKD